MFADCGVAFAPRPPDPQLQHHPAYFFGRLTDVHQPTSDYQSLELYGDPLVWKSGYATVYHTYVRLCTIMYVLCADLSD